MLDKCLTDLLLSQYSVFYHMICWDSKLRLQLPPLFEYNITSMPHYPCQIEYSDKYSDAHYEYRHVVLTRDIYKKVQPKGKLLSESEWRSLGIQQSRGWVHYEIHKPEPHILLFRRALGTDPNTGLPPAGFVPPVDEYW